MGAFQLLQPSKYHLKDGILTHRRVFSLNADKVEGFDDLTEVIESNQDNDKPYASNTTSEPSNTGNATHTSSSVPQSINKKIWAMPLHLSHKPEAPPVFLFPWSFWLKVRSSIPHMHEGENNGTKQKSKKRRWEVPLTSKPFQGVEDLRSTVVRCIAAIALYFLIGTLVFPLWLEPSWTVVDALYFSMVTLTTVGYGDIVVSSNLAKIFVLLFNVYAVCIGVSALGVITKLALAQERKILTRAKERAGQRLLKMFDSEEEDLEVEEKGEANEEGDDDEDEEQCEWADRVIDEKNKCEVMKEAPTTIIGVLLNALKSNSFNFIVLAFIAGLLQRVENWSLINVLYYWSCTAATIGFGDICPKTQLGRILAIVFIPLSVVTLGEVIANVFAFINGRTGAKAEKDFLRREITLSDLEYLDVNDDGKVCELDFISFMLVAMQKVDRKTMKDLQRLFHALDAGKDGFLQKEDLIELRQRKRFAKRLIREASKKEKWFEAKLSKKDQTTRKWFGVSF